MAKISKSTIINNDFNIGVNVPSVLGLKGGADGSYIIAANQIAWGKESEFNNKKLDGTTEGLLTAIEDAINEVVTEVSSAMPTLTFTTFSNTLQWNTAVKIANINNTDITVKLPEDPNSDVSVESVDTHYKAKQISKLGLYKIKTDAAGHITEATEVNLNDYAKKSDYDELLTQFNELKNLIDWNV